MILAGLGGTLIMDWLDTALWVGLKLLIGSISLAACLGTIFFLFALCATGVLRWARKHHINTMWMTSAFLSAFMFACGLGYGVLQH
jgi:ABC-type amino acid transport system permease subunit